MRLANPIYDAAFKYLLEDIDIAKGLISRIIGQEVVELNLKPQEIKVKSDKYLVIILRIDFKAVIKMEDGSYKKVLIEIQKGKDNDDILRFRRYLGANYRQIDVIKTNKGIEKEQVLPIITIYFLGFRLMKVKTPVVRTKRSYEDLVTNKHFEEKEDFIEQLTHDTFVIQIPRLWQKDRNELERVLKVFNQSYKLSDDNRLVEISEKELNKDPLLKKIGMRLLKAAADEEILAQMDLEEEVEQFIEKHIRENIQLKETVAEKNQALEQKDQALEQKDQALEKLKQQQLEAIKQLILYTEFSDEKIAAIQGVKEDYVKRIRQTVDEEL